MKNILFSDFCFIFTLLYVISLCCLSTMRLPHMSVRRRPGLTSRRCILIRKYRKLAYLLIFLFQQNGILSMLTVKLNWTHYSHPLLCLSMDKILHFLVFVLQLLVVLALLLLLRLVIIDCKYIFNHTSVISTIGMFSVYCFK